MTSTPRSLVELNVLCEYERDCNPNRVRDLNRHYEILLAIFVYVLCPRYALSVAFERNRTSCGISLRMQTPRTSQRVLATLAEAELDQAVSRRRHRSLCILRWLLAK